MTLTERNAILSQYAGGIYSPSFRSPLLESSPTSSGFYAAVYRDETLGKLVIVFRGVDGPNDAGSILALATGRWHPQFDEAVDFIAQIANDERFGFGGDFEALKAEVLVTGHSQGAAQTQVSARLYGLDGAAFDPAGAYRQTLLPEFTAAASRVGT